jgi:hypothetical protein
MMRVLAMCPSDANHHPRRPYRRPLRFPVVEAPLWPVRPASCCPLRIGDRVRIRGPGEPGPGYAHRTVGPAFGTVIGFEDGYAIVREPKI